MIERPSIKILSNNQISSAELESLMHEVDADFPTPLSKITDINLYVQKLLSVGTVFGLMEISTLRLRGWIAGYCNDFNNYKAFISSFGLVHVFRGKGFSHELLNSFIYECEQKGMKEIKLNCFTTNERAFSLYSKLGFSKTEEITSDYWVMTKYL